jgi:hypothetical protein
MKLKEKILAMIDYQIDECTEHITYFKKDMKMCTHAINRFKELRKKIEEMR